MPVSFEPRTEVLPKAQQEIWPLLAPAPGLSFVLYGGTAVALHLGHRVSVDFDFLRTEPFGKREIETSFAFMRDSRTIQEDKNTLLVAIAPMPSGPVKIAFFGGLGIGRIERAAADQRRDASRCLPRGPSSYKTEDNPGPCRSEGLSGPFCDAFGRRFPRKGFGCVCQHVRQGPQPCAQSDRVLQGRRPRFASQRRSNCSAEGKRSRIRNSRGPDHARLACEYHAELDEARSTSLQARAPPRLTVIAGLAGPPRSD